MKFPIKELDGIWNYGGSCPMSPNMKKQVVECVNQWLEKQEKDAPVVTQGVGATIWMDKNAKELSYRQPITRQANLINIREIKTEQPPKRLSRLRNDIDIFS